MSLAASEASHQLRLRLKTRPGPCRQLKRLPELLVGWAQPPTLTEPWLGDAPQALAGVAGSRGVPCTR